MEEGLKCVRKTHVYVGTDDPPDYCPENFVDQDDLVALLERRMKNAFGSFSGDAIMYCLKCKEMTESKHMHDCAHGIPETHMAGSERYECKKCGHWLSREDAEKQGLKYFLD